MLYKKRARTVMVYIQTPDIPYAKCARFERAERPRWNEGKVTMDIVDERHA